jgi:hypothetical protein
MLFCLVPLSITYFLPTHGNHLRILASQLIELAFGFVAALLAAAVDVVRSVARDVIFWEQALHSPQPLFAFSAICDQADVKTELITQIVGTCACYRLKHLAFFTFVHHF